MMILYISGCIAFIVLQGVFSGSEISFVSASLLRLRHRANRGDRQAQVAFQLISNPEKFLATTLFGTNLSVVISSSLITLFLIRIGISYSNMWTMLLFTPIVVIFSELIPKNIGRLYRERFSCRVSGFILFFEHVFAPVVGGIEAISRLLIRLLLGRKKKRSPFVTKEEIRSILREVESQGLLDRGEKEAIEDIFDFGLTKIKTVITSLQKTVALDYVDSQGEIFAKIKTTRFTRYPVYKNKEILGYINIFDLFYQDKDWRENIRSIARVGENQKLYDVFTTLRTKRENIALVMRGKKTLGIVTLADIMREVISSIIKG